MKFSGKVGNGPMNKFWSRYGSGIRIRIRIATLVRRALAEVCTVPVLVVFSRLGLGSVSTLSHGHLGFTLDVHDLSLYVLYLVLQKAVCSRPGTARNSTVERSETNQLHTN